MFYFSSWGPWPYDICVMELEGEFIFGPHVQPVKLPKRDSIPSGMATLSGWGMKTKEFVPGPSNDLLCMTVPIISNEGKLIIIITKIKYDYC